MEGDKIMITARDVKDFLKYIPDNASVVFSDGRITCLFDGNTRALNKWKAIWDNGIGYPRKGISCCGECSHFECDLCNIFGLEY